MPNLSNINQQSIRALTEAASSLPWYTRWLFPTQLKAALVAHQTTTNETKSAWIISHAFLNNTWLFQRLVFPCLRSFYESPLIKACLSFEFQAYPSAKETEERHDNFDAVATSGNPTAVPKELFAPNLLGVFDGEDGRANRAAMQGCKHPRSAAQTLSLLKEKTTLLTGATAQANREAIAKHPNKDLDCAVSTLIDARLLNGPEAQANLDAILTATNPYTLARLLININRVGLLTPANRDALARHQDDNDDLSVALFFQETHSLLRGDGAQANLDAILQAEHNKHSLVTRALRALKLADLLTGDTAQANRDAIVRHPHPEFVADALDILHQAGLTPGENAQINFNTVIQHQRDPIAVARTLVKLNTAGLLTSDAEGQNIRDIIARHETPEDVASAIICLNKNNATNADNGFTIYAQSKIIPTFFQHTVVVSAAAIEPRETTNLSA